MGTKMNSSLRAFKGERPIYRKGVKGKYQLVVAKKRWQSFKSKLKEVTKRPIQ